MPAFNEQELIARTITETKNRMSLLGNDYEIVVVDDGSRDGTRRVAESMANNASVRVVGYEVNKGKGHALKYGFNHATGSVTFFLDSDSEIGVNEINLYLRALRNADIAIASKRHPRSKVEVPVIRHVLSYLFGAITRLLTGLDVSDTQTGLKAAKSDALYKILPLLSVKKYAFDVEFLVVASLLGMRIVELPVEINLRSMFGMRKTLRMGIDLLGIVYRLRLIKWYQKNLDAMTRTYTPIVRW